ncbi:hypothetical protein Tco_1193927 [Tanacetum coccineum]
MNSFEHLLGNNLSHRKKYGEAKHRAGAGFGIGGRVGRKGLRNSLLEVEQDGFALSMMKNGIVNENYEQTHKEKIDYEKANVRKLNLT